MSRPSVAALSLMFIAVNACGDGVGIDRLAGPADDPAYAISDAAHQGRAGFYFRPPLVPDVSPFSGTFDGTLAPTAQVCKLSPRDCTIATFSSGSGSAAITVDVSEESYNALWKTPKTLT